MGAAGWTLGLTALGTAVSAYGQYRSAKASKKAGNTAAAAQEKAGTAAREASESQAELADYNAQVAELQSTDAVDRGADAESRFRTTVRKTIGEQRAGFAGGNIDVSYGSSVDIQADAAFLGEMDALQIRTNAGREAWGFKVQAEDYRKRGEIMRKEGLSAEAAARLNAQGTRESGRAAATANYFGMAGTLIGGTTSLLQQSYGFKNR
jgi:hypothetical protein